MFRKIQNSHFNISLRISLRIGFALLALISLQVTSLADVVTDWNQITLNTQAAVSGASRTPPASRALAMVHAAIYDSVNAIDRKYTAYAVDAHAPDGASPEAAAAAAAHRGHLKSRKNPKFGRKIGNSIMKNLELVTTPLWNCPYTLCRAKRIGLI